MNQNRLETKIKAQNLCNKYTNELFPILIKAFEPFLNEKIIKTDGNFYKKVDIPDYIPPNTSSKHFLWYIDTNSSYTLKLVTKYSMPDNENIWHSQGNNIYFANIQNGVLKSFYDSDIELLKTNYDLDTILKTRKKIDRLKNRIRDLKTSIHPFDEQVNI